MPCQFLLDFTILFLPTKKDAVEHHSAENSLFNFVNIIMPNLWVDIKMRTVARGNVRKMNVSDRLGCRIFTHLEMAQSRTWEHLRVSLLQWEGPPIIQVKSSRVSLLCTVCVYKMCMQDVKHTYKYKRVCFCEWSSLLQ